MVVVVVVEVLNSKELLEVSLMGRLVVVVVVVVVVGVVFVVVVLVTAFVVDDDFLQSTFLAKSQESAALLKYRPVFCNKNLLFFLLTCTELSSDDMRLIIILNIFFRFFKSMDFRVKKIFQWKEESVFRFYLSSVCMYLLCNSVLVYIPEGQVKACATIPRSEGPESRHQKYFLQSRGWGKKPSSVHLKSEKL